MANLEKPRRTHGGRRPGAGRKPGGSNAPLPPGTVGALSAAAIAARRLGRQEVSADAQQALQRVYERVADVLEERVESHAAGNVLKAAALVADAVAGPVAQRLEHSGPDGEPLNVVIKTYKRGDDGER